MLAFRLIIFLAAYSSLPIERIESDISYAIHDFLEDEKTCSLQERLELIAQEAIQFERPQTKKLIRELLLGHHQEFFIQLKPYLLPFIPKKKI